MREFVNPFLEHLLAFKKGDISKFANNYTRGNTYKLFKVKYNQEDIVHYIKENIVDEMILKKLNTKNTIEKIK